MYFYMSFTIFSSSALYDESFEFFGSSFIFFTFRLTLDAAYLCLLLIFFSFLVAFLKLVSVELCPQ